MREKIVRLFNKGIAYIVIACMLSFAAAIATKSLIPLVVPFLVLLVHEYACNELNLRKQH